MKVTPKRRRSDSITAAVAATQAAALGAINPPAHVALRPGDRPFWDAIVTNRARDTWNDADLCTAANLARSQADIERLQKRIDIEGDTISAANGSPMVNPKCKLIETLSRRCVSLARMVHVHAEATLGRSRDSGNALLAEKAAAAEHDDLIPTMRLVR